MAKSIFIAGALALTAIASQAFASEPVNVAPTRAVSVAGVDFRDPAAVKAFYAQLYLAADAVCRTNSANSLVGQSDRLCIERAMQQAVAKANRPMLTAMYQSKHAASGQAYANR